MSKTFLTIILAFLISGVTAQIQPIPKAEKTQEVNKNLKGDGDYEMFNNISHPLSIAGAALTVSGAALYIVGSESLDRQPIDAPFLNNYSPQTSLQYVGIGVFAAGAVLFTIFSTERNENAPKRKKIKQQYNASDWEVAQ